MSKILSELITRNREFMNLWASHNPSHVEFKTLEAATDAIGSGRVKYMACNQSEDGTVNIDMFGPFVSDEDAPFYAWWYQTNQLITASALDALLAQYPDEKLRIRIKSPGGNSDVGSMVQDLLSGRKDDIEEMRAFGMVASAGTFAYLAARKDKRKYGEMTHFLVHDSLQFMFVGGYFRERDLKALNTDIEGKLQSAKSLNRAMAKLYAEDTGKTPREIRTFMEKNQWLIGDDIAKYGFALASGKIGKEDDDSKMVDKDGEIALSYPIAAMAGASLSIGKMEKKRSKKQPKEDNMSKELEARIEAMEAQQKELQTQNASLVAENAKLKAVSEQSNLSASVAEHTATMDAAIVAGKFTPALKTTALEAIGKAENTEQLEVAWTPWASMIETTADNTFGQVNPSGETPPEDPDEPKNTDDEVKAFIDEKIEAGMPRAHAIQAAGKEFSPDAVFAYLKPQHLARQKEYMTN